MHNTSCNFSSFLAGSKLLSTLLDDAHDLEAISEFLNTTLAGVGDYRVVAQHYGVRSDLIASVLETHHSGPTTALIEYLATTRPELTVQDFAAVVEIAAKRRDVAAVLEAYMGTYETYDSKRLSRVTDAGKQFKS